MVDTSPYDLGFALASVDLETVGLSSGTLDMIATPIVEGASGGSDTAGADGREIQLRKSPSNVIQWRYVGSATWIDLVAVSDLTGPHAALLQAQTGFWCPDYPVGIRHLRGGLFCH